MSACGGGVDDLAGAGGKLPAAGEEKFPGVAFRGSGVADPFRSVVGGDRGWLAAFPPRCFGNIGDTHPPISAVKIL